MNARTVYCFEPQSPLVFRSGRPFGAAQAEANGNQDGRGYEFPLPGTVAGALRAAWADASGYQVQANDQTMLGLRVQGALLARRQLRPARVPSVALTAAPEGTPGTPSSPSTGQEEAAPGPWEPFAPAPADALCSTQEGRLRVHALLPQPLGASEQSNLPHQLQLVHSPKLQPGEQESPARFWAWRTFESWLWGDGLAQPPRSAFEPSLPLDVRRHVAIGAGSQTHVDGAFFETQGLDLHKPRYQQGLLAWMSAKPSYGSTHPPGANQVGIPQLPESLNQLHGRFGRMGADGRGGIYTELSQEECAAWMCCPEKLAQALNALQKGECFRLLLLTPACYLRNGWYPDAMAPSIKQSPQASPIEGNLVPLVNYGEAVAKSAMQRKVRGEDGKLHGPKDESGWRFRLVAAALPSWQALASANVRNAGGVHEHTRRPLQRLVPAGTVYWLEILSKGSSPLSSLWLQSTCRDEFASDGYGLAVPGLA